MTTRVRKTTVTFIAPFFLAGLTEPLPSGAYDIEIDEEILEGLSFPVYRRRAVVIHLRADPAHRGRSQSLTVDPNELDAALTRDREASNLSPSKVDPSGAPRRVVRPRLGLLDNAKQRRTDRI